MHAVHIIDFLTYLKKSATYLMDYLYSDYLMIFFDNDIRIASYLPFLIFRDAIKSVFGGKTVLIRNVFGLQL